MKIFLMIMLVLMLGVTIQVQARTVCVLQSDRVELCHVYDDNTGRLLYSYTHTLPEIVKKPKGQTVTFDDDPPVKKCNRFPDCSIWPPATVHEKVTVLSKMPIMGPDKNGKCWQRNINGGDPHVVPCPKKVSQV